MTTEPTLQCILEGMPQSEQKDKHIQETRWEKTNDAMTLCIGQDSWKKQNW